MATFKITYAVGHEESDTKTVDLTETEETRADSYTADDQWVVFYKLQPDGRNVVTLSMQSAKVLKVERVDDSS